MKSNKYWEERKLRRFSENEQRTTEYVKSIRKMYEQASRNIKKMLDDVYKNYSNDTGIDKQKLRELLTKSETEKHFEELKKIGLEKYVKDNYKSRINRLEKIQLELYKATKDLYKKEELKHSELYKEVINNGYYKAIYDTQIGVGYDFNFSNLDKNLIKSLMSEKWHGLNYSERIWNNTEIIANQIKDIVGGGLLSGQSIQKTARLVRERFDVGKFYSERLVRTESNYFHNQADLMAYEEMEVEYYIIIATLDNRTSKICQEKDGKKFKVTEALKGKNFPPFHVNCRTTTSTYIDEEAEKLLVRRARNPITGKNEVIDNVSYEEWLKNHQKVNQNSTNYLMIDNNIKISSDDFKGLDEIFVNQNIKQLDNLLNEFPKVKNFVNEKGMIFTTKNSDAIAETFYNYDMTKIGIRLNPNYYTNMNEHIFLIKKNIIKDHYMPCSDENLKYYALNHEFGHLVETYLLNSYNERNKEEYKIFKDKMKKVVNQKEVDDLLISYEQKFYDETARKIYFIALKNNKNLKLEKLLSKYGTKSSQEFFAECFVNMVSGKSNELGNAMKEFLEGEL